MMGAPDRLARRRATYGTMSIESRMARSSAMSPSDEPGTFRPRNQALAVDIEEPELLGLAGVAVAVVGEPTSRLTPVM
jgi:hypothetical protein